MNIIRNKVEKDNQITSVIDGLEHFVNTNKTRHSRSTQQKFVTLRNHLIKYQVKLKTKVDFESITLSMLDKYRDYLLDVGLTNNSMFDVSKK
jgi:hypothetical protein